MKEENFVMINDKQLRCIFVIVLSLKKLIQN